MGIKQQNTELEKSASVELVNRETLEFTDGKVGWSWDAEFRRSQVRLDWMAASEAMKGKNTHR